MYSHFSVILLCLSGVYCLSSTIDTLNWEKLDSILNGRIRIEEWNLTMDQNILYKHPDGSKTPINVREVVEEFARKVRADSNRLSEFTSIHDTIKMAYRCTLAKYVSLGTSLLLQEIWRVRSVSNYTITQLPPEFPHSSVGEYVSNSEFIEQFLKFSKGKYHLDFDVNVEEDIFQIHHEHNFSTPKSDEIHRLWLDMMDKMFGVKIKYRTYPDVMKLMFRNVHNQKRVDLYNKFMCVINETIILLDKFIVDKCVEHGGSFVTNFESQRTGFHGNLMRLLTHFDELKDRRAMQLYYDFTNQIPPNISSIKASGCFVEDLEIKISGFKMDLPNHVNPTTIYGQNINERQSEIKFKIVDTNIVVPSTERLRCMLSIRDSTTSSIEELRRPRPGTPRR